MFEFEFVLVVVVFIIGLTLELTFLLILTFTFCLFVDFLSFNFAQSVVVRLLNLSAISSVYNSSLSSFFIPKNTFIFNINHPHHKLKQKQKPNTLKLQFHRKKLIEPILF